MHCNPMKYEIVIIVKHYVSLGMMVHLFPISSRNSLIPASCCNGTPRSPEAPWYLFCPDPSKHAGLRAPGVRHRKMKKKKKLPNVDLYLQIPFSCRQVWTFKHNLFPQSAVSVAELESRSPLLPKCSARPRKAAPDASVTLTPSVRR